MPDCTVPSELTASPGPSAWQASLVLRFGKEQDCTRLLEKRHQGPLRVQKALYPEGPAVCHAIIIHPPGGVVGGDQLAVTAEVGPGAHALLTSPGAAKWYKANGQRSRQRLQLTVAAGAALEWLPQEAIFFDRADVALEQTVTLAADARYLGCEILCLGRRASGEVFNSGRLSQRTSIRRDGKLVWWEQGVLLGGALDSPLGLQGHSVCATLIAVGAALPAAALAELRADHAGLAGFGVSQSKGVLVARHLGDDSEAARHLMLDLWRRLRPQLLQRAAVVPRIWQT